MVFTRKKARMGANPEYPARTQPGTNIREVRTPRQTVFTLEKNWIIHSTCSSILSGREGWWIALSCSLFQRFFDRGWYEKYYHSLALKFHPDKNQHSQVSDVMKKINEAREELENTLHHIDEIREEERVRMDAVRE